MPSPARILRGVKHIRTRSGAPDQTVVPYRAYMAITALEMEKARRQTERQSLLARLEGLNGRLQSIDTEKAALLERLGRVPGAPVSAQRVPPRQPAASQAVCGFKHRY
jgi:hypothetical protein